MQYVFENYVIDRLNIYIVKGTIQKVRIFPEGHRNNRFAFFKICLAFIDVHIYAIVFELARNNFVDENRIDSCYYSKEFFI